MNAHDADKLLGLVQGIWLHVETYHLPHSEELRRSFRYGNTDHVIHSTDGGIGGAIARLCEYLDANMERIASIDAPTHCPTCGQAVDADSGWCVHCGER